MTQTIINLGTGGAALNGRNGSTTGADSNDALFLDWPGDNDGNYVYLPGAAGNFMSVPDEANFNLSDNFTLIFSFALDDWISGSNQILAGQWGASGNLGWFAYVSTIGRIEMVFSTTGSNTVSVASTVSVPFNDGVAGWIKIERNRSAGTFTFSTSLDGVTYTQLGTTATGVTTDPVFDSTSIVILGGRVTNEAGFAGKAFNLAILNGASKVLEIDTSVISTGAATSFAALTGQTVSINRSTSGLKTVAVVSPVWLFGSDDYMEVADNALLDFGASDSFTLVAIHRPWATQGTNDTLLAKKANTTNTTAGYNLSGGSSTALAGQAQIGDGAAGITAVSANRTSGALTVTSAVRDVTADTLTVYLNKTAGTAIADTTTGSLSNAEVWRIARLSGAGTEYVDMELISVAVFRRALTAEEIVQVVDYYQARLS
jgi:hypothetical protein